MRPGGQKAERENKLHAHSSAGNRKKGNQKRLRKQKPASDQIPCYVGKRKKINQADSQPELIPYSHKCTLAQRILPTSTSDSYQLSHVDDIKAKRSLNLYIACKQVPVIDNQPAHEIQTPGQRIWHFTEMPISRLAQNVDGITTMQRTW